MQVELYPRVFNSEREQKIFVQISELKECATLIQLKIQPMERYTIKHTSKYRIDEEDRYPFMDMQQIDKNIYALDYKFDIEQKYKVVVKADGDVVLTTFVYAVDEDLACCQVLKGDTHLHTNGSDGKYSPFITGCLYRKAGFDFIAITDHHKYKPSVEGKECFAKLTDLFTVFCGEEVHNRDMGYFHIVNFNGTESVNELIENDPNYVEQEVHNIMQNLDSVEINDPYSLAYRIFVANQIRKCGGLAIMAHPFWYAFGEYNMQTDEILYLWENGYYDVLEVLGGADENRDNLQAAIWADMRAKGLSVPVVGASDNHFKENGENGFNKRFTLVFAQDVSRITAAIKKECSVAVYRRSENEFFVFGNFRMVKYARFLLEAYYPQYDCLAEKHGTLLMESAERNVRKELLEVEREIAEFKKQFFAF